MKDSKNIQKIYKKQAVNKEKSPPVFVVLQKKYIYTSYVLKAENPIVIV